MNHRFIFNESILFILAGVFCVVSQTQISHAQNALEIKGQWEFRQVGNEKWMPATVPGTVHTDLMDNEQIPDPFYRNNEAEVQWIEKEDWEYRCRFDVLQNHFAQTHIDLNFEGLDTYADVYLNNRLILSSDNMFRSYKIAVKKDLKRTGNELRIYFHSPIKIATPLLESLPYELPAGNDAADQKVSVFTRKAPYSYGWDWGPRMVTSGLWRPVYLSTWDALEITDFYVEQKELNDHTAQLTGHFTINSDKAETAFLKLRVVGKYQFSEEKIKLKEGNHIYSIDFQIDQPKRWWSNGLGDAHLYNIKGNVSNKKGATIAETETQIGLRTIELIQEKDSIGTSYYFKLNGQPVFMKGANYIPASSFVPSVSKSRYRELIQSAVDANMNMLRVWGGGIYEDDHFYELCDKNGLLVWQDFMFACSMYPGDTAFVNNVVEEVKDNVTRLRQHPSIALWCGNNEMNVAWFNWGWQNQFGYSTEDSTKIRNDYLHLFQEAIPNNVSLLDSRPYVHTSPLSNWGTPENFNHSSMHYWGVWHGEDPFSEFKNNVGRFNSEYGFQSFPDLANIESFTLVEDRYLDSEVLTKRQKSYKGNRLLFDYIYQLYNKEKDFESFLYLNQLTQAEGIKIAIEQHRKKMPHCMGTLYWQLNDCWPAISWSSTDYYGNWKALHYFVRDAYKDILIVPELEENRLQVNLVSDRLKDTNGRLDIVLCNFLGDTLHIETQEVNVKQNISKVAFDKSIKKWLPQNTKNLVLHFNLEMTEGNTYQTQTYFHPPKDLELKPAKIEVNIQEIEEGYAIQLSTDRLAKNIYLSTEDEGFFQDNYFDLFPNKSKEIIFKTNKEITNFKNLIKIRSLTDSY